MNVHLDVTVVVPTYNRPEATVRAVQSALAQEPAPQRIIVVDDASTDNTVQILRETFGKQIDIIQNSVRSGANQSRNIGATASRTRYIAFLDSDDIYLPHKLSLQVLRLERSGAGFCCTGFVTDTGKRYVLPKFSKRLILIRNCLGGTSGLMLRRALFDLEQFDPDMPSVQDWELYLRLLRHGPPEVIMMPLYVYDQSGTVRVTTNLRKRILGHIRLFHLHIQSNPEATFAVQLHHRMLHSMFRTMERLRRDDFTFLQRMKLRIVALWAQAC